MSLSKDLLILDEAQQHQPDLIIWLISLESLALEQQLIHPIVQHNQHRLRPLIIQYQLPIDPESDAFITPTIWERTLFGQRRSLADLIRLQSYGPAWASTGIDQFIPMEISLRQNNLAASETWQSFNQDHILTTDQLAFGLINAGVTHASNTPIIIINEPIFQSDGENSDLRYNTLYPRWAYDQYRQLLVTEANKHNWHYHDFWDLIDPDQFTDTPLHLTPEGTADLAQQIAPLITNQPTN